MKGQLQGKKFERETSHRGVEERDGYGIIDKGDNEYKEKKREEKWFRKRRRLLLTLMKDMIRDHKATPKRRNCDALWYQHTQKAKIIINNNNNNCMLERFNLIALFWLVSCPY